MSRAPHVYRLGVPPAPLEVCRVSQKFSVLVGSILERSQVPLSKWLMALYMMSASKNGVAAFELHRTLGLTNKTAWFMLHRIREGMKRGSLAEPMTGTSLPMRLGSVASLPTATLRPETLRSR